MEVTSTASVTFRAYYGGLVGIGNTNRIAFWGFQVEVGDYHTSYILPGTTRARGVMNLNAKYPATTHTHDTNGFSIYIEGKSGNQHAKSGLTNYQLISIVGASAWLLIRIGNPTASGSSGDMVLQHYNGSSYPVSVNTQSSVGLRDKFKVAGRFMRDNSAICLDGAAVYKDTACTISDFAVDSVTIGGGNQPFNSGWIGKISLYNGAMSDAQLIENTED